MFKSTKTSPNTSSKKIDEEADEFVIEKIARIDGNETIKKYKKGQLLGKGGFANCYITENT